MTEAQKQKISNKLKGRIPWNAGLKGVKPEGLTFKGRKHTQEAIEKTRRYFSGRPKSDAHKKKISQQHLGKWTGALNPRWKGGKTPLVTQIRTSFEYRQWRSDVFTKDDFTCQECFDNTGGNLEAHHIKYLSNILEEYNISSLELARSCSELWNINNGITLCEKCHINIHKK